MNFDELVKHTKIAFSRLEFLRGSVVQVLAWPTLSFVFVAALWYWVNSTINTEKNNVEKKVLEEATQLSLDYEKYLNQVIDRANQITLQLQYNLEKSQANLNLPELAQGGIFRGADILNVIVMDQQGLPVTSTFPVPKDVNYADRDYFIFHQNDDTNLLLVGRPIVSRSRNRPVITFTRRLNTPRGEFAGVADVALDPDYLTAFFAGAFPGKSGLLAVAGLDGVLRSIRIGNQAQDSTLPELRTIPLFTTPEGATYISEDARFGDKLARYVAWRTLKDYPLVLMVGIPELDYFAPYQARWSTYRSAAGFGSFIAFLLAVVATGMSLRSAMRRFLEIQQRKAYRLATEGGDEGFYMYEAVHDRNGAIIDFQLIDCNLRGAEFYGMPQTQLIQTKLSSFYSATYFKELIKVFLNAMNSGFHEDEIRVSGESMLTIEWAKRRFVRSGNGLAVTVQNITERKHAEEDIRQLNERFSLATHAAQLGVWDWNIEKNELVWDDMMYTLYGVRREDFTGAYEAWLQGIHPDDRAPSDEASKLARLGKRKYDTEFRVVWPDGSIHYLKAYGQVVRDADGRPLRMTGVNYDITERKQAEEEIRKLNQELEQRVAERTAQLEAANKELEAFAYSVSHDLRAPLRHIDGFVGLLKERTAATPDEKSLHYMTTISNAARRMGTLIDDILSFSRMGRSEMAKTQVDLGALVQEVIGEFDAETQGRAIEWRVAELPIVTGDHAMLRIALVNLISNALKFTRKRSPAKIEIGCLPEQDAEIVVFVRDNGAGFDMQYADKLFGVFQRLHGADEFEGTGIGLANVRRVIQRHGGRTWAEGQVDIGATLYFSLPKAIVSSA